VLLVPLSFSFGHCVACPSVLFFWSLFCLSFCPFLLAIVLLHCLQSFMTKIKHINSLSKSTHEQHVIYEIENHDV
jgi:hypothetical protein